MVYLRRILAGTFMDSRGNTVVRNHRRNTDRNAVLQIRVARVFPVRQGDSLRRRCGIADCQHNLDNSERNPSCNIRPHKRTALMPYDYRNTVRKACFKFARLALSPSERLLYNKNKLCIVWNQSKTDAQLILSYFIFSKLR